ncbi:YaaL family protein [Evansella sp. AB-rgal1]|uniref:YaaL family protein n=1 Tax=Evansella sp. AB-rgal1 TaxID=3242696 RepID=UPI00359D4451
MLFRKKRKIRSQEDESLLWHLEKLKKTVNQKESLLNSSVDYHSNVLYSAKLEKVKYMFLLKEARIRKIRVNR